MFGKHRLQKPTRFIGLPTKWKVSHKTDEIMGNSGTATAVPAVPRAAPLFFGHIRTLFKDTLKDRHGPSISLIYVVK